MTESRSVVLLALLVLGCASVIAYAGVPRSSAARSTRPPEPPPPRTLPAPEELFLPPLEASSDFWALPALRIAHLNTNESAELRLYAATGEVDSAAAQKLDHLLRDHRSPDETRLVPLDRRVLQLVFRAAYHFRVSAVDVVSGHRQPRRRREGPHGTGRAVDFKLPGVAAAELASYLRRSPRVGVGVYTHPKTQYVHLDVRDESYHWLDASPPGRSWRERSLGSVGLAARDAAYAPSDDWPEGTRPPAL